MSSTDKELNERIERLKDLQTDSDKWFATADSAFEEISLDRTGVFNNSYESIYICALRNEAIPLINRLTAQIEALQAEVERLKGGIGRAIQKLEASDLIDLAHSAINDRYGAAKACIQKGLRELEGLQ